MSTELIPCGNCGETTISFRTDAALVQFVCGCCGASGPWLHSQKECTEAWNRRFVRLDVNEDPVFSDSKIIGTMGDGSEHECFLQYQQYQWWATDTQATFDVSMSFRLCEFEEIELIKE